MLRTKFLSTLIGVGLCLAAGSSRAGAGQDHHGVRGRLDEERARRRERRLQKESGVKVVASYAASSALAKQIEQGAPADVFISADLEWMDYSAQKKTIKDDTRVNLLGNKLVLIAPKDSRIDKVDIAPGFDLARLIGDSRITTGEVTSVPVGKYAKAALEKLGIWASVEKKFAMADNVRAALALVSPRRSRARHRVRDRRQGGPRREDRRRVPGRLASRDHLSGCRDRECEAGGLGVSQLSALERSKDRVREVWIHLPDQAGVVTFHLPVILRRPPKAGLEGCMRARPPFEACCARTPG